MQLCNLEKVLNPIRRSDDVAESSSARKMGQKTETFKQTFPNVLTVGRVFLAWIFFFVLGDYRYGHESSTNNWTLLIAMGIFVVAALTDLCDGYLARRWKAESAFGRIADPFADKLLIVGSFVSLSGPRFVDAAAVEAGSFKFMASGVYSWMVIAILARELLVTGIRGEFESQGVQWGAAKAGKWKMISQAVSVPSILLILFLNPARHPTWLPLLRDVIVHATVFLTVLSAVPYLITAYRQASKVTTTPRTDEKKVN